jgi:hypothetical protein
VSITVMMAVLRRAGPALSPTQKLLLVAMGAYADEDGQNVFPSQETLSRETSLSERAVRKALADLVASGILEVVERRAPHRSTRYRIRLDLLIAATSTPAPPAGYRPALRAGHDEGNRHLVPESESMTGTSCRDDRHLVPNKPAPRASDPSVDPSMKRDQEPARALALQRNDVPVWMPEAQPDEVAEIIALASPIGIQLQRFLLEREFIQQTVFQSNDESFAMSYVRHFIEWTVEERRLAPEETPRDPANWWRHRWAAYRLRDTQARLDDRDEVGSWRDECDRLHGGTYGSACETQGFHRARTSRSREASRHAASA